LGIEFQKWLWLKDYICLLELKFETYLAKGFSTILLLRLRWCSSPANDLARLAFVGVFRQRKFMPVLSVKNTDNGCALWETHNNL
jgi:hypothetical protein